MRSLRENAHAMVDLSVVLMIGIAFVALMVVAYILFNLQSQLFGTAISGSTSASYNESYRQSHNITEGFDDAVALILVAVTIFILAIAISALLILRGRQ